MEDHADDLEDHVNGNGVGGIAENWSDQQTIKVKVCTRTENPWLMRFLVQGKFRISQSSQYWLTNSCITAIFRLIPTLRQSWPKLDQKSQ